MEKRGGNVRSHSTQNSIKKVKKGDIFRQQFRVSGEVYAGFIQLFKDKNPLHTDDDFAKARGFQGRVMHGNILNGFISYFIGECLPLKNVIIQTIKIQFVKPVYLDETLDFRAEIMDFFESVHTYEFSFYFSNAAGTKVARGNIQIGLLS